VLYEVTAALEAIITLGEVGEPPASNEPLLGQTRDALCTFKPKSGAEETYAGKFHGVGISSDHKGALIWVVKTSSAAVAKPGLLQQSYASDPGKSAVSNAAIGW
jgi:hypothetical protein